MSKADGPITARSPTLIVPRDLYELHRRIKALKLDPGKGFASQLVKRADGAGGVAATKWPADVSLFVNDDGDSTQIDVWHDGVCGGPMLTATSAESARAIIGAIDELHGLRERLADFQADYRKVMSDQCAPDERHCSCVPHLRRRIAEVERESDILRSQVASCRADLDACRAQIGQDWAKIERLTAERDAARIEIGHLQDELIKLRGAHGPTDQAEVAPEQAPDSNALPGGGEGAVTALLADVGIADTPETRQQMRDTLMSALRAGAGPDGRYPAQASAAVVSSDCYMLPTGDGLWRPLVMPPHPHKISSTRWRVLTDVHDERERQDAKFGRDRDHALTYGGFEGRPLDLCAAYGLPTADAAKVRCDAAMKVGRVTYGHILVEEVCEVFEAVAGGDVAEVRKELVQVVAVGVAMVEALDRAARRLAQAGARETMS